MSVCPTVSEILVENRDFLHPLLAFDAPVRGSPSEYCHLVWCGKTRTVSLPNSEKTFRICVTV